MKPLIRDNFSIAEMTECSLAERMGIDNTPDLKVMGNLAITVDGLEKVRKLLGYPVHVNSGFRCEALEKVLSQADYRAWCLRVGEAVSDASWARYFSQKHHALGYAADFTCAQFGSPWEVVQAIGMSSVAFDQCILEGTWVHLSFAPAMRHEILIKQFDAQGIAASSTPFKGTAALGGSAAKALADRHFFETSTRNHRALPGTTLPGSGRRPPSANSETPAP